MSGYDIIGDVHGHCEKLRRLLTKLGYSQDGGAYRHPEKTAVFVGDFIDRGPEIRATLETVRAMVDSGAGRAILGNHEFNALRFAANGDRTLGAGLRHTLEEFADDKAGWREWLAWFRALPLFLDVAGLRVIHAAWDSRLIAKIAHLKGDALWREALTTGSAVEQAVVILLNGWQLPLPGAAHVEEFQGSTRSFIRVAWWRNEHPITFRSVSLPFDPELPDVKIADELVSQMPGYAPDEPPLFVGHYALPPDMVPWPLTQNLACVDYRAARKGPLVAYRWDGERKLESGKFVSTD